MPYTPQKCAGIRIDPPPSLPVARGHRYAATAAAAPPLDPPGVYSGIPGVASRVTESVLTRADHGELRNVGLAQDDSPGIPYVLYHGAVALWHSVFKHQRSRSRPDAACHLVVLDSGSAVREAVPAVHLGPRPPRRPSLSPSPCRGPTRGRRSTVSPSRSMRPKKSSVSSTGETCFVAISFRRSVAEANANDSSPTILPIFHIGVKTRLHFLIYCI